MRYRWTLEVRAAIAALAAVAAVACQTIPVQPQIPDISGPGTPTGLDRGFLVVRQYKDFMGPVAVLGNGSEYRLINEPSAAQATPLDLDPRVFDPMQLPDLWRDRPSVPAPPADNSGSVTPALYDPSEGARLLRVNLPAAVTLRAQQTPIKRQTGDECTWFAATAAIEAAYQRDHGLTLDLSETHFNHLLKMALIEQGRLLPLRELQLGAWGGGSIVTNLSWMESARVGLPTQNLHPNAPYKNYSFQNPGDDPDLMNWAVTGETPQRDFDDFNLRDTPFVMKTPADLLWTPLPPLALIAARYRSVSSEAADGTEKGLLDWYRGHIAAGREVVVQFACCDMFANEDGRPNPAPGGAGTASHAAILVGYDDVAQRFEMKNSWGENDFRPYHYDNITRGFVQQAVAITAVASPAGPFPVIDNPGAFLGRWLLTDKGQPGLISGDAAGVLNIYLTPGATAKRLGTFNAQDGSQYRVNGVLNGRVLTFWIDPSNPDQVFTAPAAGRRYQAMLFDDKRTMMTGRAAVGTAGFSAGFTARKIAPLPFDAVTRSAAPTPSTILKGYWAVELEGETATLFFDRYDPSRNQFIGFFEPVGAARGVAYGVVNGNSVTITSEQSGLRLYFTYFVNDAKTALAGFFGGNPGSGIVAVLRHESAIAIPLVPSILGPAANQP